jgi:general L-amino acid transport system permease protein
MCAGWFLIHNLLENMRVRGIQSGFGFFSQPTGFAIGESLIAFDSQDPLSRAFLVGFLNTLRVALLGILFTTVVGLAVGIGRLSRNFLLRALCTGYVELFRNMPVLLQILIWYFVITDWFPDVSDAIQPLHGVFLTKSGMSFPVPVFHAEHAWILAGSAFGLALALGWRAAARRAFERTGARRPVFWPMAALITLLPLACAAFGAPIELDLPERMDLTIAGGGTVTPEFLAVTVGLSLYTAAFVAEVVRSGIQSVPWGQTEAAYSLGIARGLTLRLVLLPQAVRVIVPPLTNQYLNLTKNSSLAVAIGYPDLISISNTTLNQTGRAVECIAVAMAIYLAISLATAALMNWYNARAAIRER